MKPKYRIPWIGRMLTGPQYYRKSYKQLRTLTAAEKVFTKKENIHTNNMVKTDQVILMHVRTQHTERDFPFTLYSIPTLEVCLSFSPSLFIKVKYSKYRRKINISIIMESRIPFLV